MFLQVNNVRNAASSILAPLASRTSWVIDLAWTQVAHTIVPLDPFFPRGWGDLEAVNWNLDEQCFKRDPPQLQISWEKVGEGTVSGIPYERLQGVFETPHEGRLMAVLPRESRVGTVQLLRPKAAGADTAFVLHLAGTGDHGFARRMRIGLPLLEKNIATAALESPYYGSRRPPGQKGSRLHHVADLLALGRTTIMEGLCLLQWARSQGYGKLGVTGLSMGGVHASMIGGFAKGDVAVSPHLAPRSAAVAFCEGALNRATAFEPLSRDEIRCEYVQEVARSLHRKLDPRRIPPSIDPVGVERLAAVLEAYTDVTRYPRPKRTDCAIIVAATDDAYVSKESVQEVQQHWPGSEVRWISGGHVLSFLLHNNSFRRAIADSLAYLDRLPSEGAA
uniref:Alpha beta-protein n=1 Tax=Tetraselmis sp. GSL018 TaxID=582737 RepID=A0A061RN67_9CHLO|mmetsp:Transcript_22270/g.53259  ORF Transcript_22270/g.53259 Transcript_22270/m.53259 type:complete len:391 (+) Transcript_22270:246-1418(+)